MAAVNAAKKAFRKSMKEVLKGLDGGDVGRQCEYLQFLFIVQRRTPFWVGGSFGFC